MKEKTISVDCRSDSAADGRARDEKNENKKNRVGREQWRETKEKERKNILVSVPGFRNPPFPSSLSSPATRSMTVGWLRLPWRSRLWLDDKGGIVRKAG